MSDTAPSAPAADVLETVAAASQAQAEKVRLILDRLDAVAELDPRRAQNVNDMLRAARADGGCGIGCW